MKTEFHRENVRTDIKSLSSYIADDDKALLREHAAQRCCHEEQLAIRQEKEDKAFAEALGRYTELQQRTIWQRIKALVGCGLERGGR